MTPDELEQRAKQFAVRVVKLVDALPQTLAGRAIGQQLIRCAMSTAAIIGRRSELGAAANSSLS